MKKKYVVSDVYPQPNTVVSMTDERETEYRDVLIKSGQVVPSNVSLVENERPPMTNEAVKALKERYTKAGLYKKGSGYYVPRKRAF